jgi:alginate O-acetyltransferase complex protein AlgI
LLFNSYEFIFCFLPITFFVYFYLNKKNHQRASKVFLVFSSLIFYGWWNLAYLPIIISSIIFNYTIGNLIRSGNWYDNFHKKLILIFGITSNILLLGYFKYTDFLIENVNLVINENIPTFELLLPLAISFFTFQQISFLVDSYIKETKQYDFINYAIFVTFFPQLIAGPIVHHKEMMPQFKLARNQVKNCRNIAMGIFIFSIGLFKKVVIADTFSVWANEGFSVASSLNLIEAWITSLSYTFQLYFDFSGYTDMAIGIALLFNIKLPINFNSPYKARNIQDFWRRWHITLSRFLKIYLYIPLGGNRKGELTTYTNIMATFIIGGLWHGASWTFIFWGALHGFALVIFNLWCKLNFKIWTWVSWFITFNFINVSWIFFRAEEWEQAIDILKGMFDLNNVILHSMFYEKLHFLSQYGVEFGGMFIHTSADKWSISIILATFIFILSFKNSSEKLNTFDTSYFSLITASLCFVVSILMINKISEFIYFNF